MIPNRELLEQCLPMIRWPAEYEAPGEGLGEFIGEQLSQVLPQAGFRQAFWAGGQGQGTFTSYSVFSCWPAGKNQYAQGSFSCVQAAFLYVSHVAPVACFGFGEGRWQKRAWGGKHVAQPPLWRMDEGLDLRPEAPDAWGPVANGMASRLAQTPIMAIDLERINAPLPLELAGRYTYCEGLELPAPRLLKDLLFHKGVDWTY